MNIITDAALISFPEACANALEGHVDFADSESNADWFSRNEHISKKPYSHGRSLGLWDTASSDEGRVLAIVLYKLSDRFTTASVTLGDLFEDQSLSRQQDDLFPPLAPLGYIKGKCAKPRRIEFVKEFLDF